MAYTARKSIFLRRPKKKRPKDMKPYEVASIADAYWDFLGAGQNEHLALAAIGTTGPVKSRAFFDPFEDAKIPGYGRVDSFDSAFRASWPRKRATQKYYDWRDFRLDLMQGMGGGLENLQLPDHVAEAIGVAEIEEQEGGGWDYPSPEITEEYGEPVEYVEAEPLPAEAYTRRGRRRVSRKRPSRPGRERPLSVLKHFYEENQKRQKRLYDLIRQREGREREPGEEG